MISRVMTSVVFLAVAVCAVEQGSAWDRLCPCACSAGTIACHAVGDVAIAQCVGGLSEVWSDQPVALTGYSGLAYGPRADSTEDFSLNPRFGNAVLHLDVPYDADVSVLRKVATAPKQGKAVQWQKSVVHSRGRYRHLILSDMPADYRERIRVTATCWTGEPDCKAMPVEVCRSAYLMAGDRKWLTISKDAFTAQGESCGEAEPTLCSCPLACLFAAADETTGAATASEPAKKEATLTCGPAELVAFVGYSKEPSKGGVGESFTFARHEDAPKVLKLTHALGDDTGPKYDQKADVDFTLTLTWQYPEEPNAKAPAKFEAKITEKLPVVFKYDSKKKEGTAEIPFDKASPLRLKVESVLPAKLSKAYPITSINMSASFKYANGDEKKIKAPIKIRVIQ